MALRDVLRIPSICRQSLLSFLRFIVSYAILDVNEKAGYAAAFLAERKLFGGLTKKTSAETGICLRSRQPVKRRFAPRRARRPRATPFMDRFCARGPLARRRATPGVANIGQQGLMRVMTAAADRDRGKQEAARRALELVRPGMRLGLGTGTTARHFVDCVGSG